MALIKAKPTGEGTELFFSQYQDAYNKAHRIEAKTGFIQSAKRTNEGFMVFEPKTAQQRAPRQQSQQQDYPEQPQPQQQQSQVPENLGYEVPPRMPPGLYDGKW